MIYVEGYIKNFNWYKVLKSFILLIVFIVIIIKIKLFVKMYNFLMRVNVIEIKLLLKLKKRYFFNYFIEFIFSFYNLELIFLVE